MCTAAIYKHYYCIIFLSKHKANTTELHPKVRQTCLLSIVYVELCCYQISLSELREEHPGLDAAALGKVSAGVDNLDV